MLAVTFRLVTFFRLLCSFRVWCYQLFFWSPFFCLLNGSREKKKEKYNSMTIVTFVQFCFCYTILPIFFFLRGEKISFWGASLVNASRRDHHQRASSAATTGTYSLFHSGPITNSWNHFFLSFFLFSFNDDDTIASPFVTQWKKHPVTRKAPAAGARH